MNDSTWINILRRRSGPLVLAVLMCFMAGCPDQPNSGADGGRDSMHATLRAVDLSDPIRLALAAQPIQLRGARNEWLAFTLEVSGVAASGPPSVRIRPPRAAGGRMIDSSNLRAYQVLSTPIDVDPGYVRHTGASTASRNVPRALLPLRIRDSTIDLSSLRDPTQPTRPAARPNGSAVLLWLDVHVPPDVPAGQYLGQCELVDQQKRAIGTAVGLSLTVYDFALPNERHLQMIGNVSWGRLAALYPEQFGDTITPSLINRRDPRYQKTVSRLDQLMTLAEENRATLIVPGLRPTVKWPAGEPPQIDWREFDALVGPWMSGETFADHVPLRYWPLPAAAGLDRYDLKSQLDYWSLAAAHFDQLDWLARAPVWLHRAPPAGPTAGEERALVAWAAQVLSAHPRLRVTVPLDDEQLAREQTAINDADMDRIVTAAAGLVSSVRQPAFGSDPSLARYHWIGTDLAGADRYAGSDERDVRVWAWLAFLRRADLIVWDQTLPLDHGPSEPSDPNALIWFYPGEWFGTDAPLPTVQLKWLRRAAQDYEYLWLAKGRGEVINALQMARLLTKPVEVLAGEAVDPAYSLLSGTTNQQGWDGARELLAKTILLRQPGQPPDAARQRALYLQTLQWAQPQERPLLMARAANWTIAGPGESPAGAPPGNRINLELGLDIYNASDRTPDQNLLRWEPPPPGSAWQMRPQPVGVPRLQTYHIRPAALSATFGLDRITAESQKPIALTFIDGDNNKVASHLKVRLPVAASDRREGPLVLDGKLNDWTDADSIQDGPLVMMVDRPDLQNERLATAPLPSRIYSCWGRDNFYLAFALEGLSPDPHQAHNDVHYQARRAWGEDLCEVLVQPVYADNSLGPVLHVVCKPNGADWVERKSPPQREGEWNALEGAGVRYATTTSTDGRWRGELGIPWKVIGGGRDLPVLLRFNFSQHRQADCQSASWAGPVDYGRDERLMGVLYLRTPRDLGVAESNDGARGDDAE